MSAIPPLPVAPEPEDEPRVSTGFAPPPWGVGETLAGFAATFLVVIGLAVGFSVVMLAAGIDQKSVVFRYGTFIVLELALLAVPVAAVVISKSGPAGLGLARPRLRGLLEGAALGAVMWGVTEGYSQLLALISPAVAKQLETEAARQMELLAGPAPLLAVSAIAIAPFCEECLFRGFVFGGFRRQLGFAVASGLSAMIFALFHFMAWSTIPLFFVGLSCAAMYERHRTLYASLAVHVTFNAISVILHFATT